MFPSRILAPPPPRCCPRCLRGRRGETLWGESCAPGGSLTLPRSKLLASTDTDVVLELQMQHREAREGDERHRSTDDNTHTEMCQTGLYLLKPGCALGPQLSRSWNGTPSLSFARTAVARRWKRECGRLEVDCRMWSRSKECSRGMSNASAGQNTHLDIHRSSSPITLAVQVFIKLSVYPSLPIQMQISRSSPPCTERPTPRPFRTFQYMPASHCIFQRTQTTIYSTPHFLYRQHSSASPHFGAKDRGSASASSSIRIGAATVSGIGDDRVGACL